MYLFQKIAMFLIRQGLFFLLILCFDEIFLLGDWAFEEVFHIFEWNKILPIGVIDPFMLPLYKYRFTSTSSDNSYCCLLFWRIMYLLLIVILLLIEIYLFWSKCLLFFFWKAESYNFWFINENTLTTPVALFKFQQLFHVSLCCWW